MMFMHKYSFFYSMERRLKIRKIKDYLCITNYYFMFFKISQMTFYRKTYCKDILFQTYKFIFCKLTNIDICSEINFLIQII